MKTSLTALLLLWPTLGFAQSADGAVASDTSIGPVVENLATVITTLEERGVQITDVSLGSVKDDGVGVTVPLDLLGPATAAIVGVGDERKISDLDLAVTDGRGRTYTDDQADNNPVVQFETTEPGEWSAKVVTVQAVEGQSSGYYMLVTGYGSGGSVISASGMATVLALINAFAESNGLTFVHGVMKVLDAGKNSMVELTIPAGQWSQCAVFGFGDPTRVKKLSFTLADAGGNVLGKAKKSGMFAYTIIPTSATSSRYLVTMTPKLQKGISDGHGMALAACR